MSTWGVARLVGSVPHTDPVMRIIGVGDLELYRVSPPLCGYHVIAAQRTTWAMRAQYIHPDGRIEPAEPDDPVSTDLYGVTGEGLQIDRDAKLPGSADGRNVARTLAGIGYRII
ncbi:hypothetical protein BTO20_23500 [Mycobacterium dioxanotrophicus]|uniref:Uncharacterized protein n=1 Tax=Mycobacterium dioxanotrophicus TaxID=482462 RepID=A0A1Y0C7C7_9MYCO|nr:hypothetical protein [Mycobacterium dioxanotrophicus]ART71111.1 hypothetical protein BTO20_23500 [Mycobacterium dioxanotrophicus]